MVMVTVTGVIRTRDHFKVNSASHLPIGYGDSVAGLFFSKAENLSAVAFSSAEQSRFLEEARLPSPVRVRK
jgi:hypothetical protein